MKRFGVLGLRAKRAIFGYDFFFLLFSKYTLCFLFISVLSFVFMASFLVVSLSLYSSLASSDVITLCSEFKVPIRICMDCECVLSN